MAALAVTDLFSTPPEAQPHCASDAAPEATHASGAFVSEQDDLPAWCGRCGVDPCACDQLADGAAPPDAPDVDPFPVLEQVAAIIAATPTAPAAMVASWQSPFFAAAIDRRAELQAKHGERAVTDPSRPAALMAHDLKERACAILDRLSGRPRREQMEIALNTLATAGALALSLHDRLRADLAGEATSGR